MIGIVGGSGDFGQGLAERLRRIGEGVVIGSRTPRGDFLSNPDACFASSVVFLSVPPEGVADMSQGLRDPLAGRIVVSVAAPVVFRDGKPGAEPGELSLAEITAAAAPEARVVSGFHTVSAKALADPDVPLEEDILLAAGWVRIAGPVTWLFGKNESGKTTFLEALYRLNPVSRDDPATAKDSTTCSRERGRLARR